MGSARGFEVFLAANAEFLDGFQAIGGKSRRCNGDAGDALAWIGLEDRVGGRLKPFGPPEP